MYSTQPNEITESPIEVKEQNSNRSGRLIAFGSHQLFVRESGKGENIVLLHGFPDHSENLEKVFDALAAKQRVVSYDQLGLGRSDNPEKNYSVDQSVEDLCALQDQMNWGPMTILGHSMGGTIGTLFTAKYPDRVKSLVLMNPALKDFKIQTGMNYRGAWFLRLPLLGELMLLFHNRMATKQCLKLAFHDRSKITEEIVDRYHFPYGLKGGKSAYLKLMRSIYPMTDEKMLQSICKVKENKVSVFLIWSERDWSMPIEDGYFFSEKMGATLHTIADCGHSPHLELNKDRLDKDLMGPIQAFLDQMKDAK